MNEDYKEVPVVRISGLIKTLRRIQKDIGDKPINILFNPDLMTDIDDPEAMRVESLIDIMVPDDSSEVMLVCESMGLLATNEANPSSN